MVTGHVRVALEAALRDRGRRTGLEDVTDACLGEPAEVTSIELRCELLGRPRTKLHRPWKASAASLESTHLSGRRCPGRRRDFVGACRRSRRAAWLDQSPQQMAADAARCADQENSTSLMRITCCHWSPTWYVALGTSIYFGDGGMHKAELRETSMGSTMKA
jgi:hypothetical protein